MEKIIIIIIKSVGNLSNYEHIYSSGIAITDLKEALTHFHEFNHLGVDTTYLYTCHFCWENVRSLLTFRAILLELLLVEVEFGTFSLIFYVYSLLFYYLLIVRR